MLQRDLRLALRPNDVFANPLRWQRIDRVEACARWRNELVVVVAPSIGVGAFGRAEWFSGDSPYMLGTGPYDFSQLRYYRYTGQLVRNEIGMGGAANGETGAAAARAAQGSQQQQAPAQTQAPQEEPCEMGEIEVACAHKGRKAAPASAERPNPNQLALEVVAKAEKLSLKATPKKGPCGRHVVWDIGGSDTATRKGVSADYEVKLWRIKTLLLMEVRPKRFTITARQCNGPQPTVNVTAYPSDKIELTLKRERPEQGGFGGVRGFFKDWDFELKFSGEAGDITLKKSLFTHLMNSGKQSESVLKKIQDWDRLRYLTTQKRNELDARARREGETGEISQKRQMLNRLQAGAWDADTVRFFPELSVKFACGWEEEETSHLAFFKWEIEADITVIKGTYTIPFGYTAAIPAHIKKWTTDWIGDAYLYIKIEGAFSINGKMARVGVRRYSGDIGGKGVVGVKVGGTVFLAKKQLVSADVNGGTSVDLELKFRKEPEGPSLGGFWKWNGLKAKFSFEALWGWVTYEKEWTVIEGMEQPKQFFGWDWKQNAAAGALPAGAAASP